MHVVFLGICRDIYPSSLGYWIRNNYFGDGSLHQRLQQFSNKMREACRRERCLNNLHLTHVSKFPGVTFHGPPESTTNETRDDLQRKIFRVFGDMSD